MSSAREMNLLPRRCFCTSRRDGGNRPDEQTRSRGADKRAISIGRQNKPDEGRQIDMRPPQGGQSINAFQALSPNER
jgi:hypothetical protein